MATTRATKTVTEQRDLPGLKLQLTEKERRQLVSDPLGHLVGKDKDDPIAMEVWANILRERNSDNPPAE